MSYFKLIDIIDTPQSFRLSQTGENGNIYLGKPTMIYPNKAYSSEDEVLTNSMRTYKIRKNKTDYIVNLLKTNNIEFEIIKQNCGCANPYKVEYNAFVEVEDEG